MEEFEQFFSGFSWYGCKRTPGSLSYLVNNNNRKPQRKLNKVLKLFFLLIFIQLKIILYILYCHKFSKLSKLLKIVKVVKIVKIIKNSKIMSGQLKMINPASRTKTKISPKEPLSVSCNVVQQMWYRCRQRKLRCYQPTWQQLPCTTWW